MKSAILSLSIFISSSAFAGSIEAIKAVLDNREVVGFSQVDSIVVLNTFRCLNCYDIKVTGNREIVSGLPQDSYVVIRTEGDLFTPEIKTEVIERSR